MRKHSLIISLADRDRLLRLIDSARLDWRVPAENLDSLHGELARATIVAQPELPSDVVAMNSTVWFRDLDTEEVESYTLVFPTEADVVLNRISVFAPIGTALLGYRLGEIIEWHVPSGRRRLQITNVVQPTAALTGQPADAIA